MAIGFQANETLQKGLLETQSSQKLFFHDFFIYYFTFLMHRLWL